MTWKSFYSFQSFRIKAEGGFYAVKSAANQIFIYKKVLNAVSGVAADIDGKSFQQLESPVKYENVIFPVRFGISSDSDIKFAIEKCYALDLQVIRLNGITFYKIKIFIEAQNCRFPVPV